MREFKNNFKQSSFYFWLVLVVLPSLKEAFIASETRGRAVDVIIALVVSTISVFVYGNLNRIEEIGGNFYTLMLVLGVAVFLRVIFNIFSLPANLYFDALKKQDRFIWDENIRVDKKTIVDGKLLVGYGICVKNRKPYDLDRVLVRIQYLEIDGILKYEADVDTRNRRSEPNLVVKGKTDMKSEGLLRKDNGEATFYLLDINTNSDRAARKYVFRLYGLSRDKDGYAVEETMPVTKTIKGELVLFVTFNIGHHGLLEHEYSFEINVDKSSKPQIVLSEGRLAYHKPSTS